MSANPFNKPGNKKWEDMNPDEKKKGAIGGVIILIVLLVLFVSCAGGGKKNETQAAVQSQTQEQVVPAAPAEPAKPAEPVVPAKPAEPVAPPKEVVVVDAATILGDFKANEASADLKYKGKVLQITGVAGKVDTEFLSKDKYSVLVNDGSPYSFVSVTCGGLSAEQAAVIAPDAPITIEGEFKDGGDLGVNLKTCKVL